jgi:hypothetical protein
MVALYHNKLDAALLLLQAINDRELFADIIADAEIAAAANSSLDDNGGGGGGTTLVRSASGDNAGGSNSGGGNSASGGANGSSNSGGNSGATGTGNPLKKKDAYALIAAEMWYCSDYLLDKIANLLCPLVPLKEEESYALEVLLEVWVREPQNYKDTFNSTEFTFTGFNLDLTLSDLL